MKLNVQFAGETRFDQPIRCITRALGTVTVSSSARATSEPVKNNTSITFTTPGKPIDFLGMHLETTVNHFIPPVVGAFALVGGILLLVVNPKRA